MPKTPDNQIKYDPIKHKKLMLCKIDKLFALSNSAFNLYNTLKNQVYELIGINNYWLVIS